MVKKIKIGGVKIKKELSQIIIEGHTDDVGSYIYNMELSQKRAFEVIKYIYDEMPNFKGKEELKSYITANGRSNIKVLRETLEILTEITVEELNSNLS